MTFNAQVSSNANRKHLLKMFDLMEKDCNMSLEYDNAIKNNVPNPCPIPINTDTDLLAKRVQCGRWFESVMLLYKVH